jgi:PAS domain-containing protein
MRLVENSPGGIVYASLIENAPVAIIVSDEIGSVVLVNQADRFV